MGKHTKENAMKKKKKEASDFWDDKATFVAGLFFILEIIKDILKLFSYQMSDWFDIICFLVCLIIAALILGTKKFDPILPDDAKLKKCGNFWTVGSILIYIVDRVIIIGEGESMAKWGMFPIYLLIVIGGVLLLLQREEKK